jgi:hypothetical protein
MNIAEKYFVEKMKDDEFRKAYNEEKLKLDIEFLLDDLIKKIKMESSYNELLKGAKRIRRTLNTV